MFSKNTRSLRTLLFSLAAVLGLSCLMAAHAGAAISWWSKARQMQESDVLDSNFLQATSASGGNGTLIFDVVVSLYNDPQGDDEYDPADVNNDDQEKYEKIVEYWADSIYEQSNGVHRLGTVRIFTNGTYANRADVVWNEKEWPRASVAGFDENGKSIMFGDIFPDGCGSGCDHNMLNDAEGAGYTLGHEWGHYVYGLYDEYVGSDASDPFYFPLPGDTPPTPAIMNSQWNAQGGNYDWLNH